MPDEKDFPNLNALRGLRTAPSLDATRTIRLRQELEKAMEGCAWFTVGVMAPSSAVARATLRQCEAALAWPALTEQSPAGPARGGESASDAIDGPVFLKGNQRTGTFMVLGEAGLGVGLLITGHQPADPDREDTWGPLPLDLFAAG